MSQLDAKKPITLSPKGCQMLVHHRLCLATEATKTTPTEFKATASAEEVIERKTKVWLSSLRSLLRCCVAVVVIVTSFVGVAKSLEKIN